MDIHRPTRLWRLVSAVSTAAAVVALSAVGTELARAVATSERGLVALGVAFGAGLAGLLVADLVSGLVHFAADHVVSADAPLVGPNLVAPFRDHHRDPRAMVAHDLVETNGDTCLAAAVPLGLYLAAAPTPDSGTLALALTAFTFAFSSAVALTNQIHQWAHAARVPRLVAFLQRRKIILDPAVHAAHHAAHDAAYCITTGWCNSALDRVLSPTTGGPHHAPSEPRESTAK